MTKLVTKPRKALKLKKKPATEARPVWCDPKLTTRKWMSWKGNAFEAITALQENNNEAFNILVDIVGLGDNVFNEVAQNLDDMNIRGEQIVLAYQYAGKKQDSFIEMVNNRIPAMIEHVNAQWPKAFMERAVPSGAHKYMHKKIITPPPGA